MTQNKKGTGTITFDYYSTEELNSILEKMQVPVD